MAIIKQAQMALMRDGKPRQDRHPCRLSRTATGHNEKRAVLGVGAGQIEAHGIFDAGAGQSEAHAV